MSGKKNEASVAMIKSCSLKQFSIYNVDLTDINQVVRKVNMKSCSDYEQNASGLRKITIQQHAITWTFYKNIRDAREIVGDEVLE